MRAASPLLGCQRGGTRNSCAAVGRHPLLASGCHPLAQQADPMPRVAPGRAHHTGQGIPGSWRAPRESQASLPRDICCLPRGIVARATSVTHLLIVPCAARQRATPALTFDSCHACRQPLAKSPSWRRQPAPFSPHSRLWARHPLGMALSPPLWRHPTHATPVVGGASSTCASRRTVRGSTVTSRWPRGACRPHRQRPRAR